MSVKQDRQGVRTATDVEQKYNFGKRFAELMGLVTDARESVASSETSLRNEILEQSTKLYRDAERYTVEALKDYVTTDEMGKTVTELESKFEVTAEDITMDFYNNTTKPAIDDLSGDVDSITNELEKHFVFSANGLIIKAGEGSMNLVLDNDIIRFEQDGRQFGWWDGVDFHTGNIVVEVNERAQFGDFAFVPRSNGSLDFLKVGG